MATDLQRDLAKAVINNRLKPRDKRKNKRDLTVSVGYSLETAESKAGLVIAQKGVQDAIKEIAAEQGLTEDFIKRALLDDIEKKPQKRVEELKLGASILGMTEHEKKGTDKTLVVIIAGESAQRYGISTAGDDIIKQ